MSTKQLVSTTGAPAAIGTYSQAIRAGSAVYLSGQIGLDPASMQMQEGFEAQTHQVFKNLKAVCEAAGGSWQFRQVQRNHGAIFYRAVSGPRRRWCGQPATCRPGGSRCNHGA